MASIAQEQIVIRPQPGPQELFLSVMCDIAIYGGAAGGGKSYALLLDALRYAALEPVRDFGAVIFRRESPQITNQGGLWDDAGNIYPLAGGRANQKYLSYSWAKHKTRIRFSHMQLESDKESWQGAQIPFIGFDELTHFLESQFFYMLSRNRSTCGVKPRMRATTNPDADSWVKRFLAPWVDDHYPDPARSGEIRCFVREDGQLRWLARGQRHPDMKSVTFIEADVHDNPALLKKDPGYIANLRALPLVERERLLNKNWNIRHEGGTKFKRGWFPVLETIPDDLEKVVRYWDFAATEVTPANSQRDGPDYTASVKIGRRKQGAFPRYVVLDATWDRLSPGKVETLVRNLAEHDGRSCPVCFEEEGGASGKSNTFNFVTRVLDGFEAHGIRATGSKEVRANTFSSQAEAGNVGVLRAHWNDGYFGFLEPFPSEKVHDDPVDASSGAMEQLYLVTSAQEHIASLQARVKAQAATLAVPTPADTWREPIREKAFWE